MNVSPTSLSFPFQPGSGTPPSQTLLLTSANAGSQLAFNATVNAAGGAATFATINQGLSINGSTPSTLTIAVNQNVLNLLGPGTYVNNVVITSNAGNSPVTVPLTLTVSGNASLTANPASINLNYQTGQATQPPNQVVTISSTGGAIQFTAAASSTTCGSFLSVSPQSGSTAPTLGQNGGQISVSANFTGITLTPPMTCSGTVTVTPANSTASITITVNVNIVSTAVIDIGVPGVSFVSNGSSNLFATVPLTSSDSATSIQFSAFVTTSPQGQGWVTVFPQSGFTASNLTVQVFPTNLPAGPYSATLTIQDNRAGSAIPIQTIPITMIVASQATATPASLTFALLQGGTVLSQNITVGNVPSGATIGATVAENSCTGSTWLNATVSGNSVSVGINGLGLTVGQCTGVVSIIVPGATNSPLNVTVTVNITNPATLTLSSTNVSYSYAAGSTTFPQNQTVQLGTSNSSAVAYTTSITAASGGNFFSVAPASGNTPQSLSISMNSAVLQTLGAGTYTGTVTISSTGLANVTIGVTLTVTSAPPPSQTVLVNAATQQPGAISPGEIVTIYGTNIGPVTAVNLTLNPNGTVSDNIGNTQVMFDGIPAPLIYVSATQINLIVPYEMAGRFQTSIGVVRGGVTSNVLQLRVADTSPGIFTSDSSGHGQGAILNQNSTFNGPGAGAAKGSVISIYATGEGQISPPGVTGTVTSTNLPIPKPVATPVTLVFVVPGPNGTIVNVPATIQFAGEAPTLVSGVLQVNAVVPASVSSGANTIVLTVGTVSSPLVVTVQVQ
jgi:uncharacterized protein (TIGR03437 family)